MNKLIKRDFEGEHKLKEEIADKVIAGESIPLPKADVQRDYMIMIGAYVFKHSDILFLQLAPNEDPTDKEKEDGIDAQVIAHTAKGVFRCALASSQGCLGLMRQVTDKVNELIATQKEIKNECSEKDD